MRAAQKGEWNMNVSEFRKCVASMTDKQLEFLLLNLARQGAAAPPKEAAVQPAPKKAKGLLPGSILEEMETLRAAVRRRSGGLDAEHMKWLRTCETLQNLPRKECLFQGASDLEVYQRLKALSQEKCLPESLSRAILGQLMAYLETGSMRPVLMVGEPGCGKTTAAQYLAELLGLPCYKVSAPKASTSHGLSGETRSYRGADAGEPVQAMLTTGIQNPVLIFDEVDKITRTTHSAQLDDELLSVCDGARDIWDNFVGCRFDLSACPVFMTANELERVSEPLRDRCLVIRFPEVDLPRLHRIMERYTVSKLRTYHGRVHVGPSVVEALTENLYRKGVRSIRQHQKLVDNVLDNAYFKALEGENAQITAENALWAVEEIAAAKKKTVGF